LIPRPVVQRLPKYLAYSTELVSRGVEWVSSGDLAEALGLTSSTVRQDLSNLDLTGVSKRGYDTRRLQKVLHQELGTHRRQRIVIVGAGNLGCALGLHGGLKENGFDTCGIFDSSAQVVGRRVGRLKVRPMSALAGVVRNSRVDVGIVAVPADAAQEVADQLVAAGVKGLLNLTHVHVNVREGVGLIDARLLAGLQELSHAIRSRRKGRAKHGR